MILYHVARQKMAKRYRETGYIKKPVRGFDTLKGAMAWAIKVNRQVIYQIEGNTIYKLPDHHNKFGTAYFFDEDIPVEKIKCILSPEKV